MLIAVVLFNSLKAFFEILKFRLTKKLQSFRSSPSLISKVLRLLSRQIMSLLVLAKIKAPLTFSQMFTIACFHLRHKMTNSLNNFLSARKLNQLLVVDTYVLPNNLCCCYYLISPSKYKTPFINNKKLQFQFISYSLYNVVHTTIKKSFCTHFRRWNETR